MNTRLYTLAVDHQAHTGYDLTFFLPLKGYFNGVTRFTPDTLTIGKECYSYLDIRLPTRECSACNFRTLALSTSGGLWSCPPW